MGCGVPQQWSPTQRGVTPQCCTKLNSHATPLTHFLTTTHTHRVPQVIGVRLVLKEAAFVGDPEGLAVAAAINAHLPPDICVFSVQRTNKGFDTRRWCNKRSYEYYLPASVLQLETPDGSSQGDREVLALFRNALGQYVGNMPFHNFAGNRKQYVQQRKKGELCLRGGPGEEQACAEHCCAYSCCGSMGRSCHLGTSRLLPLLVAAGCAVKGVVACSQTQGPAAAISSVVGGVATCRGGDLSLHPYAGNKAPYSSNKQNMYRGSLCRCSPCEPFCVGCGVLLVAACRSEVGRQAGCTSSQRGQQQQQRR